MRKINVINTDNVVIDSMHSKKQDLSAAIRGMWVIWMGGKLDQVNISLTQKEISRQLFQAASQYLTTSHPEIDQSQSGQDPEVLLSIWVALLDGFTQKRIVAPMVELVDEIHSSIPLLGGVDSLGRNILHYLAQKKCESNLQSIYLEKVGSGFAMFSLALAHFLPQYSPLTTVKDIHGRTPCEFLWEIIFQNPGSITHRQTFLKNLILFETPTLLKCIPLMARDSQVFDLLTNDSTDILMSSDVQDTISYLGGPINVGFMRCMIASEREQIFIRYQEPYMQKNKARAERFLGGRIPDVNGASQAGFFSSATHSSNEDAIDQTKGANHKL